MKKMSFVKKTNRVLSFFFVFSSVLLAALIFSGWYYVISMGRVANRTAAETINMKNESDQLSILTAAYKKVLPEEDLVFDAIPKEKEISVFLADFENQAKADNITVKSSTVGDVTSKTKGDLSQTISKSNYSQLPIKYQVSGSFSDFNKFIQDTGKLRRLNTMSDLSLNSDSADKSSDIINATFTMSIYLKQE